MLGYNTSNSPVYSNLFFKLFLLKKILQTCIVATIFFLITIISDDIARPTLDQNKTPNVILTSILLVGLYWANIGLIKISQHHSDQWLTLKWSTSMFSYQWNKYASFWKPKVKRRIPNVRYISWSTIGQH